MKAVGSIGRSAIGIDVTLAVMAAPEPARVRQRGVTAVSDPDGPGAADAGYLQRQEADGPGPRHQDRVIAADRRPVDSEHGHGQRLNEGGSLIGQGVRDGMREPLIERPRTVPGHLERGERRDPAAG